MLKLKVTEALPKDVGRSFARISPDDMKALGIAVGDIVEVKGKRITVCKVMLAFADMRGQSRIQLDGLTRENAAIGLDEMAEIRPISYQIADQVFLTPLNTSPTQRDMHYIGSLMDGLPIIAKDRIRATLFGSRTADFTVEKTIPNGPVLITSTTELVVGQLKNQNPAKSTLYSYEDIGGLKSQVRRIREMIELPLRYPEVFERLGVDAPKGVMLYGPPGCGKTLLARIIAQETESAFFTVSGPEIVHKFYGESEAHLRKIFEEASRKSPSIIFIDEIDAIAPKREQVVGEVEKRIVAQLLALMDGLNRRQQLIVIAATNLPNSIDPALRRPGRFDREICIPIPDRNSRLEILEIHSRGMPLAQDVDMAKLADSTHGFVGADLEALCKEAAMSCLRTLIPDIDFSMNAIPYEQLVKLEVSMSNFLDGLCEIEPSALREVFVEIPNVTFNHIGGHAHIKQRLIEAVEWPLKYADLFKQTQSTPSKGILLVGPPGCGKTLLAKAIANESNVNFIAVKGPELLSKYVGESEKAIREIFSKARHAAPCIIFFDEIDALICSRGAEGSSGNRVAEQVLSQFLAEFDGIEDLKGVLVLGATNRLDMLDAAVVRPGRFDEIIEIGLPDILQRQEIFAVHLKDKPCASHVKAKKLAQETEGFSGAQIGAVCNKAALYAIRRVISLASKSAITEKVIISLADIELALNEVKN